MSPHRTLCALFTLALCIGASASHAIISINEPWVRAAPDGRTAEVFVRLRSSEAATLAGVDSFAARRIEMRESDGRRALAAIELPANTIVELKPDSRHLRMSGLVRALKQGEHVPITLIVRSAEGTQQKLYINAEVRRRSPSEDEMNPHSHAHPRR